MSTIAITTEGILRKVEGGSPIPEGIMLYYGLATRAKLVLLTDALDDTELKHWLTVEGMREHERVVYNDVLYSDVAADRRVSQVNEARKLGHDVTLVIDPDPATAAALIVNGYSTLLFTHAEYAMPAWRPDYEHVPQPWDTLAQQVAHEAFLRASDPRQEAVK